MSEGHTRNHPAPLELPKKVEPPESRPGLEHLLAQLLRCHPEERRAKANRIESYALEFERWANQGDEEWEALRLAAAKMQALAAAIRPQAS